MLVFSQETSHENLQNTENKNNIQMKQDVGFRPLQENVMTPTLIIKRLPFSMEQKKIFNAIHPVF